MLGGDAFDVAADDALERLEILLDLANLVGVGLTGFEPATT